MNTRTLVSSLAVAALCVVSHRTPAWAQAEQRDIATRLLGSDPTARRAAVLQVERMDSENVGPELRTALIETLDREGRLLEQRYRAGRRGETLPPLEDPEFVGPITRAVARLQDPAAIPALVSVLGTGSTAIRALVAFGEPAAPEVIATVLSRERNYEAVNGGLIALRLMVEEILARPLSAGVLADIRRAAEMRLVEPQDFITTVWWAIDLAVVLDDIRLNGLVQSIAANPASISLVRGTMDAELIETTRRRATERLTGVPSLPRPERR